MNKHILFFIFPLSVLVGAPNENDSMLLSNQTKQTFKKEGHTINSALMQQETKDVLAHQKQAAIAGGGTSDIMIVDPKVVSKDWADAFTTLQNKKVHNIEFVLKGGKKITSVAQVEPLPGGYLMLFTIKSVQGIRYEIVKTAEITALETN